MLVIYLNQQLYKINVNLMNNRMLICENYDFTDG